MPPRPALSTTSYAILGMLAVRPWTAYELTRQLRRGLRHCWPKAESVLYDEPKRLVRLGLATARDEPAGRRTRAVYTITGEGRRALAAWLATPPAPPRLEIETMLRLLYADQGSKDDVLAAIATIREWAAERLVEGRDQVQGYLDDGGPFPSRLHIIALFARFYGDLFELVLRWADLAAAEVAAWPRSDSVGMTERTRQLLEELVARLGPLADRELAAERPPALPSGIRRAGR